MATGDHLQDMLCGAARGSGCGLRMKLFLKLMSSLASSTSYWTSQSFLSSCLSMALLSLPFFLLQAPLPQLHLPPALSPNASLQPWQCLLPITP